uniref:Uncharacterized protein n=1 Tax=Mustela putorius furo TaxID=9669 RepID=M3XM68_MUSPF
KARCCHPIPPLTTCPNRSWRRSPPTSHLFLPAAELRAAGHKGRQPPPISQEKVSRENSNLSTPKAGRVNKTPEASRKEAGEEQACISKQACIRSGAQTGAQGQTADHPPPASPQKRGRPSMTLVVDPHTQARDPPALTWSTLEDRWS